MNKFKIINEILLNRLSIYLNNNSDYINENMINDIVNNINISIEEAYKILLLTILELIDNKEIIEYYTNDMIKLLDINKYKNNLYYKNIKLTNIKDGKFKIQLKTYKPYEAFVYNDLKQKEDGRIIPQVGFFKEKYTYPCVLENNREWMLITPNEIETMEKPIKNAFGNVLTYGLGLGYFQYMISLKENVEKITIIENNKQIINLFKKYILPQFEYKEKIKIICTDAYLYANKKIKYDYVFVDIWHDPSDGIDAYLKFKKLELENTKYDYWIEDTIKCYL